MIRIPSDLQLAQLVGRLAACAMDEGCIAPAGASLANHRYEQAEREERRGGVGG